MSLGKMIAPEYYTCEEGEKATNLYLIIEEEEEQAKPVVSLLGVLFLLVFFHKQIALALTFFRP